MSNKTLEKRRKKALELFYKHIRSNDYFTLCELKFLLDAEIQNRLTVSLGATEEHHDP